MSRVTRFSGRDPGPAARVSGFMESLRSNGFNIGVRETEVALAALSYAKAVEHAEARMVLRAVCSGSREDITRFDALFDAYWMNAGRVHRKIMPSDSAATPKHTRSSIENTQGRSEATGNPQAPDDTNDGPETEADGTGQLVASRTHNLMKKDLREIVSPDDIRDAEIIARRLGQALRDRRSRRRKAAQRGARVDLRRTIRKSLASGGEPLRLAFRKRPDRAVKLAVLCDVSGSMTLYAKPFLAFLSGLMRADPTSDAYLFHTRLVRISEALRDDDPLRSLNRVTLLADGFGGGSRIGANLDIFARTYARRFVDGRTVVIVLSDGYDSDSPDLIGAALAKVRQRGCRVIWLNPLKSWSGYEPIARGMASALPHLDIFASASTLADLAALEPELTRL